MLILASSSPFRRQLLEKIDLPFSGISPDVDESPLADETPQQLVERLAVKKAQALATQHPNALIIGSDQVATFEGDIIGKPHTREKSIAQLQRFSGQSVTFLTGLALLDSKSGEHHSLVEPFTVHFRALTDEQIAYYVDKEQPFNCAGSIKSEGFGITLFEKLEGEDPNALVGLPLIKLTQLLAKFGVDVLAGDPV